MNRAPLLSIGVLALMATLGRAQHAEFDVPHFSFDTASYPEGIGPWASRVADLDGDGHPDLVSASWPALQARLSILFGDGRGGFEAPLLLTMRNVGLGVAVADFDGDGDLDIAASLTGKVWDDAFVSVFRNDGNRTFTETGPFPAGTGPTGLAAADFDGDGDVDLAAALDKYITAGNEVSVMLNDGTGAFGPPQIRSLPSSAFAAAAGDLNGDGRPDLVVAGESHDLSVMLNTGSGLGAATAYVAVPPQYLDTFPTVELGDVDNDGDLDVVYSAEQAGTGPFQGNTGLIGLLRNRGDGTFTVEQVSLLVDAGGATGLAIADVTGDGWPDLLAAQGIEQFWSLVPGDGQGGFGTASSWRAGEDPVGIHATDVDGDGDLDVIAVAKGSFSASVHENPGDGAFARPSPIALAASSIAPAFHSELWTSDLDGDRDADLLIGFGSFFSNVYGVAVRFNDGSGHFGALQTYSAPTLPEHVAVADLNADGAPDVVWVDDGYPSRLRYRLNDGSGGFKAMQNGPVLNCDATALVLGDVDGNGRPDAVVVGCLNDVQVSRFTTAFQPWQTHTVSNFTTAVALDDLDGDGDLDLVTNSNVQGWLEISLGNGDGTFQAPLPFQSGFNSVAIATGDLDGDGDVDVVTADENSETMSVMLNRGGGILKPPVSYAAAGSDTVDTFHMIGLADVDDDGDLDVLTANFGSQDVSLWRNHGNGTFDADVRLGVGRNLSDVDAVDVDGDGVLDLLATGDEPQGQWFYPSTTMLRGIGGDAWVDLGHALAGTTTPVLQGRSTLVPGLPFVLRVGNAPAHAAGVHALGTTRIDLPLLGGTLVPNPQIVLPFTADATGTAVLATRWPGGVGSGFALFAQSWILDSAAPAGASATNAVQATVP